MSVRAAPKPGDIVAGKYEIVRVLGEGGMGVVYQAWNRRLHQQFALKTLLPEMLQHPTVRQRFEREARAAAKLSTPYAAKITDVLVTPEGVPFLVMELLEGRDLATLLREKRRLPIHEAVDYVLQAAAAMLDAHEKGIVHRDLKPSNLFLARERGVVRIKVLDFGISKEITVVQGETGLTRPGTLIGTMSYGAPEQLIAAATVDARADIWSLGVVLYELLAGLKPFRGDDVRLGMLIMTADPQPLREVRSDAPPELEAVVLRTLEKRREDRYANMGELIRALLPFAPEGSTFDGYVRGVLARPSDPNDDLAFADTIIGEAAPEIDEPASLTAATRVEGDDAAAKKAEEDFEQQKTTRWHRAGEKRSADETTDKRVRTHQEKAAPQRGGHPLVAAGVGTLLGAGLVGVAAYFVLPNAPLATRPTATATAAPLAPVAADAGAAGAGGSGSTNRP